MKPPKCPVCQKEHWSTQRCGAKKVYRESSSQTEDAPVSGVAASAGETQSTETLDDMRRGPPLTPLGEAILKAKAESANLPELTADEMIEWIDRPLTPAEKQKAYRQRIKDDPERYQKYLESERMRKRNGR